MVIEKRTSLRHDSVPKLFNKETNMSNNSTAVEMFIKGSSAFSDCSYGVSVDDFSRAIRLDPEFSLAYLSRAVAKLKLGNLREAVGDFTKYIELNPDKAKGYHMRGLAYLDMRDYDKAIADFDKAIEMNSGYGVAYLSRGTAHSEAGNTEQAEKDLTIATRMGERAGFDFMMEYNIPWRNYVDVKEEDIFPEQDW